MSDDLRQVLSVSGLCDPYGISRMTAYKCSGPICATGPPDLVSLHAMSSMTIWKVESDPISFPFLSYESDPISFLRCLQ